MERFSPLVGFATQFLSRHRSAVSRMCRALRAPNVVAAVKIKAAIRYQPFVLRP
jgi:hypothetical protein